MNETNVLLILVKPHYPTGSFDSRTKTSDEGKSVTLKCEPEGNPKPIKVIWEKNNAVFRERDTNDPNLMFDNVTRNDAGTYVCKASNKAGSADTNPTTQLIIKCMYTKNVCYQNLEISLDNVKIRQNVSLELVLNDLKSSSYFFGYCFGTTRHFGERRKNK